ncbi:MAG: glucokinase [Acidiferrobacteraceae bacterium]
MTVLAVDLGGTTARLALADVKGTHCSFIRQAEFSSSDYPDIETMLAGFLEGAGAPGAACLAVAGPVTGNRARITNLPWIVDAQSLAGRFGIGPVKLINDMAGIAYSIPALGADAMVSLQSGTADPAGARALIAAGTGLGQGILLPDEDTLRALPTEGGHVDFAPRNHTQAQMLEYLQQRHKHVSYERVVSGPGLETIYAFLNGMNEPELGAAEISSRALDDGDSVALQALDLFVDVYGAQAGNLALSCLATGGVYVAGGIAPKILPRVLEDQRFAKAFVDKGRMSDLLRDISVTLITHPSPGLLGAAIAAGSLSW